MSECDISFRCSNDKREDTVHKLDRHDSIDEQITSIPSLKTPTKKRSNVSSLQDISIEHDHNHSSNLYINNEHHTNSSYRKNDDTEQGVLPNSVIPNTDSKNDTTPTKTHQTTRLNARSKYRNLCVNTNYRMQEFLRKKDEFDEFNHTGIPSPLNEENLAKHNEMFPYIPPVPERDDETEDGTLEGFRKTWNEFKNAIISCFLCDIEQNEKKSER